MKKYLFIIMMIILFAAHITSNTLIAFAEPNEDNALDELAQKMLSESEKFKGKSIGMFRFTTIEGKESNDGARISDSLLERLISDNSMKFIDRSELHKIIAENELAQSGLTDTSLTNENGKILPIDLMITGTYAAINSEVNISARVVNAKTGELFIVKSCRYNSKQSVKATASPEAIALYKKSPDELDRINRAYLNLEKMSINAPLIFLLTVMEKREMQNLGAYKPRLAEALKKRKEKLDREDPERLRKIQNLRIALSVMKNEFPSRYEEIMTKKNEAIEELRRRRRN